MVSEPGKSPIPWQGPVARPPSVPVGATPTARRTTLFVHPLTAVLLAAALGCQPGPELDPGEPGVEASSYHRRLSFRCLEPPSALPGLYLFDMTRPAMAIRLLLLGPDGRPVILTSTVDAPRGIETTRIQDDRTGWWAQVDLHWPFQGPTVNDYTNRFIEEIEAAEGSGGWALRVALRTRDRLRLEGDLQLPLATGRAWIYGELERRLRKEGTLESFGRSVPAGLEEALAFVEGALAPPVSDVRDGDRELALAALYAEDPRALAELLLAGLPGSAGQGAEEAAGCDAWELEMGEPQMGLALGAAGDLALTARFRSIDASDPLADCRAADLAGGS